MQRLLLGSSDTPGGKVASDALVRRHPPPPPPPSHSHMRPRGNSSVIRGLRRCEWERGGGGGMAAR